LTRTVMIPMIGEEISSYTTPNRRTISVTRSQCFNLDTLLQALSSDGLNPLTKERFDPRVETLLRNRYATELKLYAAR
jgi:hypothetical protein